MFLNRPDFLRRLDVRLTIYYTFLLLAFTGIVLIFIYFRLERTLLKQVDRLLQDEMLELMRKGEHGNTDFVLACEAYSREISRRQYYPVFFRVMTAAGTLYFQNFDGAQFPLTVFGSRHPSFYTISAFEKPAYYRVHLHQLALPDGREYVIEMATPLKFLHDVLDNYLENVLIIIPLMLVLSVSCGILVSRKPRAMIKSIVATTNSINAQNLRQRLPAAGSGGDETRDLMRAINAMMDRLEKAFAEIKYFTADVSHELRNPLFSLKGAMEVALTRQRSEEEYHRVLNECIEQLDTLIKMVNDLFLISRFELKNVDLDLSDLNLREVLDDLYDFFLPLAREKRVRCVLEKSDDVRIKADKTKICQLISNLIENAVKFTPAGGAVELGLSADEHEATFTVRDSGAGIPEADMPFIFNRFYQVDKSRSGSPRGSGLGLNICKMIVEAHGGSITALPNTESGVTFIVKLPLR